MANWIEKVRHGDFAAIPWRVSFEQASELALLIDGYGVCGGVEAVVGITNSVLGDLRSMGRTRASPLDLWVALFGLQRAIRFGGYPPSDDEEFMVERLVILLRLGLTALTPKQRAGIAGLMRRQGELLS